MYLFYCRSSRRGYNNNRSPGWVCDLSASFNDNVSFTDRMWLFCPVWRLPVKKPALNFEQFVAQVLHTFKSPYPKTLHPESSLAANQQLLSKQTEGENAVLSRRKKNPPYRDPPFWNISVVHVSSVLKSATVWLQSETSADGFIVSRRTCTRLSNSPILQREACHQRPRFGGRHCKTVVNEVLPPTSRRWCCL